MKKLIILLIIILSVGWNKKIIDLGSIVIYPDILNNKDTQDAVLYLSDQVVWQCKFFLCQIPSAKVRCQQAIEMGYKEMEEEWCKEVNRLVRLSNFWCALQEIGDIWDQQ